MKFGFCRGTNVVTLAGQTIKFPADFHSYKHSAGARMRKKQGALWPHKSPDQTIDSKPVSLWGRLAAFWPKIAPQKQGRSNFTSISSLFAPHEIWVSLLQLRRRETNLPLLELSSDEKVGSFSVSQHSVPCSSLTFTLLERRSDKDSEATSPGHI